MAVGNGLCVFFAHVALFFIIKKMIMCGESVLLCINLRSPTIMLATNYANL